MTGAKKLVQNCKLETGLKLLNQMVLKYGQLRQTIDN